MSETEVKNPITVILLDDEDGILNAIKSNIGRRRPSWEVITTRTGDACLLECDQRNPDVVIIDEQLSGQSLQGHDVHKRLLEKKPKGAATPILIVLTGQIDPADALRQKWPLGQAFIRKSEYSSDPDLLVNTIEETYKENVGDPRRLGPVPPVPPDTRLFEKDFERLSIGLDQELALSGKQYEHVLEETRLWYVEERSRRGAAKPGPTRGELREKANEVFREMR